MLIIYDESVIIIVDQLRSLMFHGKFKGCENIRRKIKGRYEKFSSFSEKHFNRVSGEESPKKPAVI